MLDFLKRGFKLVAPVSGKVIDLSEVPDDIFADRMVGEGVAIDATDDIVVAPADGEISLIFKTNHAFGMLLDNDIEVLVHIGLDTISLGGEGFKRLVEEGQRVKAGDPILKVDREYITSRNCSLVTPVLITNHDMVTFTSFNIGKNVTAGSDVIFEYKLK
ncbi:MAG: PTS glucose transporter subunit IIA [Clostridiales bacterium]|uniref:PTS sugar transporter subunit IIA n=1 Tax=Clostridium sp. N3C TaxID=1776758 RepID=UPI00092E1B0D|nr:PTS glucose transporter subunit IIA [Clostridium sp. N3C]NLZ48301.1 PTS glucose transporter subunit IIA [Clostridiales bacterium]SCN22969.1 Glucose-specific phosphotransferase enzyme IIA component [Clostridium sp. N3C]